MTSIYDIPYEDIQKFLLANNTNFTNKDDAYNKTLFLLKDKKSKGHTIYIIEWMIAHNLLICKIDIPTYTIYEIDNMTQKEINNLAKLLTMKGNNIENIKNILKFLHKLNDIILDNDIKNIIINNLIRLKLEKIDFETIDVREVINLLKTYNNNLIRKSIYDNMKTIIFHNILDIDFKQLDDLKYHENLTLFNRNIKLSRYLLDDLFFDNIKNLSNNYTELELHEYGFYLDYINNNEQINIIPNAKILIDFIMDLIKINEIILIKRVLCIIKKYKFTVFDIIHNEYKLEWEVINQFSM